MSVNKYDHSSGQLTTLANGQRTWIGTKDAYNAAKQAGTLPNDCLIAITNDENDRAISGTNLLDNPWFTVNQREQSSYTGSGYTVDRWYMDDANSVGTLNVTSNGVSYVRTATTNNPYLLWQKAEAILPIATYTLSVKYRTSRSIGGKSSYRLCATRNTVSTNILAYLELPTSSAWSIATLTFTTNEKLAIGMILQDRGAVDGGASIGDTIEVACAKLELGTASTLENDTAPNYATELLKCQRYFYRFKAYTVSVSGYTGFSPYAGGIRFMIPLPVGMRAYPSISVSDVSHWGASQTNASGAIASTTVQIDGRLSENNMSITFENSAYTVSKAWLMYALNANAYIDFSADL